MKRYRVVIPYYTEFHIMAKSKKEALIKAHTAEGHLISYDDTQAEIEEENCDNITERI